MGRARLPAWVRWWRVDRLAEDQSGGRLARDGAAPVSCTLAWRWDGTRCGRPVLPGAIAQLVERLHGMQEVWGSNPHSSTQVRMIFRTPEQYAFGLYSSKVPQRQTDTRPGSPARCSLSAANLAVWRAWELCVCHLHERTFDKMPTCDSTTRRARWNATGMTSVSKSCLRVCSRKTSPASGRLVDALTVRVMPSAACTALESARNSWLCTHSGRTGTTRSPMS